MAGRKPYSVEERADAQGRVRRYAKGDPGPLLGNWEEGFGEWQENRQWVQVREFQSGPIRRMEVRVELFSECSGCRLIFTVMAGTPGLLGWIARRSGLIDRASGKILAAIEQLVRQSDADRMPGARTENLVETGARDRFNALAAQLDSDTGLTPRLIDFLQHAPMVALRSIRPLALARLWHAPADQVVELLLAATQRGILVMGWDLLCPRCRGAKSRVSSLHELPSGAHCSSCNIDYQRSFSRNVELTFHPAPWLRPLPEGELCLLGPGSTPHIKLQAEVAARSDKTFRLSLAPGPYRFRTVEAGGEADAEIDANSGIPTLVARDGIILLEAGRGKDEVVIRNEREQPLYFVIEDRNWTLDALTGERVIGMPVFRRLCPEQLLRPGDNAEIGRITIMFTDLVGSTGLYDTLGDATAYSLVRGHFAFLSERVQRHNGFIVKTVGDAVMAAFSHPDDAIRAALAIHNEISSLNSETRSEKGHVPLVLKIGLHSGSCIAITTGNVLDYFGATVNIAARLEHQCAGGEVIVSGHMMEDSGTRLALAGRTCQEDSATLRGVSAPIHFVRVKANPDTDVPVSAKPQRGDRTREPS
jgi:class 3 adenylate cyclase